MESELETTNKARSEFGTTIRSQTGTVKFRFRNVQPPRNIVGPVVRALREKSGLTQPMLVARLNLKGWDISRETLAKIESQIRWVADFEVCRLASALQVSVSALLIMQAQPKPRRRR